MVNQAIDWLELEQDDQLLDLFSGLGNFSLPLASRVDKVIAVEGVAGMVEKARLNAENNHISNCYFYHSDLNSCWQQLDWWQEYGAHINKVVLDPARAGAWEAVKQLTSETIKTLVYVSCDPATLARDSAALFELGYQMDRIALMDMFPQTKHIETMARFVRV
jgi:23S rRNA (uracil1939-C5)-methyltransferase